VTELKRRTRSKGQQQSGPAEFEAKDQIERKIKKANIEAKDHIERTFKKAKIRSKRSL
jgi:hypothetical protein